MQVKTAWIQTDHFGVRKLFAFFSIALSSILLGLSSPFAIAQDNSRNVLVVFSSMERDHKSLDLIESAVRARFRGQVNFYTAFLDHQRFADESYRATLAQAFRGEYRRARPDVVMAGGFEALRLATEDGESVFPGVPIVFFGVSPSELKEIKQVPGMTGVTNSPGVRETIDLALLLHPDTTAIAVIDAAPNFWWRAAHTELVRHQDKVREIDILGPPSPEMLARVAALPPHTIILFQLAPPSSAEPAVGAFDILTGAAKHLPTYSAWNTLCFDHGCIGGAYGHWEKDDLLAGDMAGRLLAGERFGSIPIVDTTNPQAQVDWRELQRWQIPESALPAGTVILYRPPLFWENWRRYVTPAIILIAALVLLIGGLLWERTRKRKAEASLRESEKRFRVMAEITPTLVWMCDPKGRITYLNERRLAFTGPNPDAGYGETWIDYVHPDDRRNVRDVLSEGLKDRAPFSNEYRLRRTDGVFRWMFDVASPRLNGDGSFAGFIGSAIDVTEQKLAQQALEKVSGQLIEAQEEERSRIARELHDDICQRLALLSMEIDQANRSQRGSSANLEEVRRHCSEIADDVQSLSHKLHSSKLNYLGVVAAIRGFCGEFSKQHEVSVEFTDSNTPRNLSKEVALCLFRVAQEALHNAVKYSGANEFSVEIKGVGNEIQLTVRDKGSGFDVEAAKKNRGLGLVSMQERVHLVHGRFSIESQIGIGTTVLVVVPFAIENGNSPENGREIANMSF